MLAFKIIYIAFIIQKESGNIEKKKTHPKI